MAAFEQFAQTPSGFFVACAELAQESVAPGPATFRCTQHDDRATPVKNGQQGRRPGLAPRRRDEIHGFVAWDTQGEQRVDG